MRTGVAYCLVILNICIAERSFSQNTGIGTTSPTEKLDVNGNIGVSGEIKPNGLAGQNGTVLMSNGAGGMRWSEVYQFKNQISFTDTNVANINWVVPAGVSRVWIEAWGGGGAGLDAGGGGGAYISIVENVTPGQTYILTIGKGAVNNPIVAGQTTSNGYGTDTRVETPIGSVYYAGGGGGAWRNTANPFTVYKPGEGGRFLGGNTNPGQPRGTVFAINGQPGGPYKRDYQSISSNQYSLTHYFGNGGAAANSTGFSGTGQIMQYLVTISPSSSTLSNFSSARAGLFPGGGGSGADSVNFLYDEKAGANGMILLHY